MKRELFRKEALDFQKSKPLGAVIISAPPSFTTLTVLSLAFVACILIFLIFGSYARKETVSGYLVPDKGLVQLYSPDTRRVESRRVTQGQLVKSGDVILVLSSIDSSTTDSNINALVTSRLEDQREILQRQIDVERERQLLIQKNLREQIQSFEEELTESGRQLESELLQLDLFKKNLERSKNLLAEGFISDVEYQAMEREMLKQQALVQSLIKGVTALEREKSSAEANIEIFGANTNDVVAEYQKQIAEIEQRIAEMKGQMEFAVRAPVDGVVAAIFVEPGETVSKEKPLVSLIPDGAKLTARLFIPSRAAGFISTGQRVRLRYMAFPYQRFGVQGGNVSAVSRAILSPSEVSGPVRPNEPVYEASVMLDSQYIKAYGDDFPLRPGMVLEADIELDRHSLLRWLLDPLYSAGEAL